ncbi:MAG: D-aminoacyl-tRNA deacylase [Candidatus Methanomethylophilaceae archaeon]|nr:D-aminoacyl-tRNA deacylase [Candidatus Methanomethylophilaceae archaeon]MDI3541580.1 D-aminoacyl-tRNA deacylase [Candidatus Methanomethylophilaceae archaeon]HIJ00223.1 hypothetical protein [Candidatus Methanomethylophilaceae archaeon]
MRLLVSSEEDPASRNMKDLLLQKREWKELGTPYDLLVSDDMILATVKGIHIYEDGMDKRIADLVGLEADEVVFLSRHRAASSIPTLTVHPIGNFAEAKFGGRDGVLVPPAPSLMNGLLRRIASLAKGLPFQISFEVTHHGPWLETPTVYMEIGSDETMWGCRDAADCLTDALLTVNKADYPVLIGLGGGHYAPRFTEVALSRKANFGHMIPSYVLESVDRSETERLVRYAIEVSGAEAVYIHRKSMKRSRASELAALLDRIGVPSLRSGDLEPL